MIYQHPYDAIINLGRDCQVQYQLTINKLRPYSLPFDYILTPFTSLCAILRANFADYTEPDNFELMVDGKETWIQDKHYGTRLIHCMRLNEHFLADHPQFKEKYDRRIERFQTVLASSARILFIRKGIDRTQSERLSELLAELYPHLDFTLAALGGKEASIQDWALPRVKNFYLVTPKPYVWTGDNNSWRSIFSQLELLKPDLATV